MVRTLDESFDPRNNSLNLLRLLLALAVVVSHAPVIGAYNVPIGINNTGAGQIAVYGFFGMSGYLIAGSASRNSAGRYIWQRFLRIFPGFWMCLLVTALFFGVLAWLKHPLVPHCGLSCYFSASHNGPFEYIYRNLTLHINQNSIAGTPIGTLAPLVWNGSLWTLYFEFICYLILMVLALVRLLRHRGAVLALSAALWMAVAIITLTPSFDRQFTLLHYASIMDILKLSVVFMAGAVIYLYRDVIPDSGLLALACGVAFVGCLYWPTGGLNPALTLTSSDLMSPLVAYPLLWLGIHLPFYFVGHRNDYSYGIYIYGFPVTQILVIFGVWRWGLFPYMTMVILGTFFFAIASWWIIEKHALKLKGAVPFPSRVSNGPLSTSDQLTSHDEHLGAETKSDTGSATHLDEDPSTR